MPNYYTQMSAAVTGTDEELKSLQDIFDLFDESGEDLPSWGQEDFNDWIERVSGFEDTEMSEDRARHLQQIAQDSAGFLGVQANIEEIDGKKCVFIRSDESADVDAVAHILKDWLSEMKIEKAVQFEWASTASKPVPNAFGGGAAHITATEIKWMDTSSWLEKLREKPQPEEAPEP